MRHLSAIACFVFAFVGCDKPAVTTSPVAPASPSKTVVDEPKAAPKPPESGQLVGHVRVSLKKVSVGKVPLKQVDGTITYSDEPRLMIAVRIEHTGNGRGAEYHSWVPDLDAAKTVAKLVDDRGNELKRVTFGFGNNVKDRTVLDTLAPGKTIGDLLVFESPSAEAKYVDLVLPGKNVGVAGEFKFRIEAKDIVRAK